MTTPAPGDDTDLDGHPVAPPDAAAPAVPVIDLTAADHVSQIAEASRTWGFFQIVNHGIPAAQIANLWLQVRRFFALPDAQKSALRRSRDNPWGYYDNELTKNRRDKKEVFDFTAEGNDPIYHGENRWPQSDTVFRATLLAWYAACSTLSLRLLDAFSAGLGVPGEQLSRHFHGHTSFVRLNYYPVRDPLSDDRNAARRQAGLGVHHHTDAGALTVLLQDTAGGLQVYNDGYWYDVMPHPDALVVNTGDMLQVWSNDRYRAAMHRVLAMQQHDRYSVPFFFNPSATTAVQPLAGTINAAEPPRYRPVDWATFRGRRSEGDYADYGPEIQISQYRV